MKFRMQTIFAGVALSVALVVGPLAAQPNQETPAYGPELEGFEYPFPVQHFAFTSQRQSLQMAYLDVKPDRPNGQTAVLLHGKNFCAATWEPTIKHLVAAGYRVIASDQIGFCKSSKPAAYQFTFKQLAGNTHELLTKLGIERAPAPASPSRSATSSWSIPSGLRTGRRRESLRSRSTNGTLVR